MTRHRIPETTPRPVRELIRPKSVIPVLIVFGNDIGIVTSRKYSHSIVSLPGQRNSDICETSFVP